MKRVLILLALAAGCGKPYPVAPAVPLAPGCFVYDTLWQRGDTVLVMRLRYPEGQCPKR